MIRPVALTALLAAATLVGCEKVPEGEQAASRTGDSAAAPAAVATAPSGFQPGQWQMTANFVDVSIASDNPAAKQAEALMKQQLVGQPQVQDICVSRADVEEGLSKLLVTPGNDCQSDDKRLADGAILATYQCRNAEGQTATIRTTGEFGPGSLTTATEIKTAAPDGTGITMRASSVGKRLGDC